MFSKKNLHITLACVLLIGLALMGVAYGAWTETLTINGTVATGTFDVRFQTGAWINDVETGQLNIATCLATVSPDGATLTITVENAYPGYQCEGGANIINPGTIPAKINGLQPVDDNSSPYMKLVLNDWKGANIASTGSFVIPAGAISPTPLSEAGGIYFNFVMPADVEDGETFSDTFTYTILAEQAQ